MINLIILKWGDYYGLSGWALSAISCIPIRDGGDLSVHRGEGGKVNTEANIAVIWLQAKELQQPSEAGTDKEWILL